VGGREEGRIEHQDLKGLLTVFGITRFRWARQRGDICLKGREGGSEGARERGRERGSEGGRERGRTYPQCLNDSLPLYLPLRVSGLKRGGQHLPHRHVCARGRERREGVGETSRGRGVRTRGGRLRKRGRGRMRGLTVRVVGE